MKIILKNLYKNTSTRKTEDMLAPLMHTRKAINDEDWCEPQLKADPKHHFKLQDIQTFLNLHKDTYIPNFPSDNTCKGAEVLIQLRAKKPPYHTRLTVYSITKPTNQPFQSYLRVQA